MILAGVNAPTYAAFGHAGFLNTVGVRSYADLVTEKDTPLVRSHLEPAMHGFAEQATDILEVMGGDAVLSEFDRIAFVAVPSSSSSRSSTKEGKTPGVTKKDLTDIADLCRGDMGNEAAVEEERFLDDTEDVDDDVAAEDTGDGEVTPQQHIANGIAARFKRMIAGMGLDLEVVV